MAFTRKALAELGLSEEAIEKVMTLHGTSMSDFMPKSELQTEINKALETAKKDTENNLKDIKEYQDVVAERDMLRALSGKEFESIKPKFREQVYKMLKREEGAEPTEKQLENIRKDYEEYFMQKESEQKPTPQFGSDVTGTMPKGDTKPTFEGLWGLSKKGD